MTMNKSLTIIGNNTFITVAGIRHVPAKVDTGATISSIWASDIRLTPENHLLFKLFAPSSPLYTGVDIEVEDFQTRNVRNSTGQETVRYQVYLTTSIKGKKIRVSYTLADRSRNDFPVLIGRRALKGKFLVDVAKVSTPYRTSSLNVQLNAELQSDPQAFHQKYMENPRTKHNH